MTHQNHLWAVRNIFELIAFASSYEIGAKNVYVYAYNKSKKLAWSDNRKLAGVRISQLIKRNFGWWVVIELNKNFKEKYG